MWYLLVVSLVIERFLSLILPKDAEPNERYPGRLSELSFVRPECCVHC